MKNQRIFIRLESRRRRGLALGLTLVAIAALAGVIVQPVVAERLATSAVTMADRERAMACDPTDPALHLWLARAYEREGDIEHARSHFEEALRLRPADGYALMQAAVLAERRRDRHAARAAMRGALALDPHNVAIRWDAALLALRLDERDQALEHLRYVLAVDPTQRDAAFQLGRALLKPHEDPQVLLPAAPEGVTAILAAALDHADLALASVAWARAQSIPATVPVHVGRRYLQQLLDSGRGLAARGVWTALVHRAHDAGDAVWNGSFEAERLLGWGFDWRIQRVWGVDVAIDPVVASAGRRSLRLTFNTFPTLDFGGVTQLVAVEPGREYRLTARAKASAFETRSGVKLEIVRPGDNVALAATNAVTGTTDWIPLTARVRVPGDVSLVMLRVRRERTASPEGNLGGKVWIDDVSLR